MAEAYLLCRFKAPKNGQYPQIDRFCIASQQATSMADSGIYAEILSMDGANYSEARERLLDVLTGHPYWSWVCPFLQE